MDRKTYREAFDQIPFSADFQERTANLLRQRARELEKENKIVKFSKTKKMAVSLAAAVALLVVSVSAALVWLTPSQVAEHNEMPLLAEAFQGPDAIVIDETVETGDFAVTLMGLVSGEDLDTRNPDPGTAHTYAVLSLRRLDGEPLENETFDFSGYTMTPLAAGCSPNAVNNWTLGAFAQGFAENGLYYYLLDTESIEKFADHTVYMAFYEGGVPNNTIFTVNDDGTIAFCDDFTGVHALFTLPLDPAKADPAAAEAFLEENPMGWTNERTPLAEEGYDIDYQETTDGELVTIIPSVPEIGTPYSADDFERDLALRRETWDQRLENGKISQADYDEWNQRQEYILSGLRDGRMIGVQGKPGYHYYYDVSSDGTVLPDHLTDQEPACATEAEFQVHMEKIKADLDAKLTQGLLSQAHYDMVIHQLNVSLEGIQTGRSTAIPLKDGGMFVGPVPDDWMEYRLTDDGTLVSVMKDAE